MISQKNSFTNLSIKEDLNTTCNSSKDEEVAMQLSSDEHSPLKTQQFYFPGESLSMTDEDDEDTEVEELDVSLAMLGLEFV